MLRERCSHSFGNAFTRKGREEGNAPLWKGRISYTRNTGRYYPKDESFIREGIPRGTFFQAEASESPSGRVPQTKHLEEKKRALYPGYMGFERERRLQENFSDQGGKSSGSIEASPIEAIASIGRKSSSRTLPGLLGKGAEENLSKEGWSARKSQSSQKNPIQGTSELSKDPQEGTVPSDYY